MADMQPSNREVAVARLCAYGRSLGCTRSDQRHGRLRAAHISLRRSGSSTAVIVTERPFVQRRRCPGLTLLGPGNLESRCSTFGQPPLRGRDRRAPKRSLLIDFLCESAVGPTYYRGRDMALCHRGMRISESDWSVFLGRAAATLAKFQVPDAEQREVVAFVQSLKNDIVE